MYFGGVIIRLGKVVFGIFTSHIFHKPPSRGPVMSFNPMSQWFYISKIPMGKAHIKFSEKNIFFLAYMFSLNYDFGGHMVASTTN